MSNVDFKVVLLGDRAVGKTSLLKRFINDTFNEDLSYQNTIGVAFAAKQIQFGGYNLIMGLWDTAGCERFESMVKVYYRGAKAAIVCYDVTNPDSFKKAKFWVRELREVEDNCKVYLCATKKDIIERGSLASPDLEFVETYAQGIQSKFFVTSSKTGLNVDELFVEITKDYISNPENAQKLEGLITLTNSKNFYKSCC